MVLVIWVTIRFIILVRNSRIAIRIYIKVVVVIIIIIIIFVSVRGIFMTKVIIIINRIIRKSVIEGFDAFCLFR